MNKRQIRWIIALMSSALIGIIGLQVYWILHDIHLKEQQFDQTVNQAMNAIVDRIERSEAADVLQRRFFDIDPATISHMMMSEDDADEEDLVVPSAQKVEMVTDTAFEVTDLHALQHSPYFFHDLDNADINIEFHRPGTNRTFLRIQRRNLFQRDSVSQHTIRSSQITRVYGDSAEVIIRQNEEKIKARLEKLRDVMQKMAVEFAGKEPDIRQRIDPKLLDSLISHELGNRGIHVPFQFGVLNGVKDSLVISKTDRHAGDLMNSKYRVLLFPNDIVSKPDYLILQFPNSIRYVLSSMWLMLGSSTLFTFIIVFGFAFTIHVILRQKKLSDIKTDFINNMTHEFKTPIATISLAVDSIKDPRVSSQPEKLEYFSRIIREENKRMNKQVEHVLQMAQLEKGELSLRRETVDLHDTIRQAVDSIGMQVASRGGKIETRLEALHPAVTGDPVHLMNVVLNLLDNANKYSPEAPDILIASNDHPGGILISVRDQGMGMTKETQKRIFEKFYRVPTGNIHDIKGFGLGLSYVKAIVEKHRGWIRLDSDPGKGSTFEIYIPHS